VLIPFLEEMRICRLLAGGSPQGLSLSGSIGRILQSR
jgi:hypothetical protein